MPVYSELGARNRDLFLQYRNTVLIYFEDEGYEEFYLRILRRLNLDLHFEDVFCLGGKGRLKNQMAEIGPEGKRRIFVFDKDFDDLLGKVVLGNEVVYLSRYSIENYLLQENKFLEFIIDKKKRMRREEVSRRVEFGNVLSAIKAWYEDVCRHFIIAQKFNLKIESTKIAAKEIIKEGSAAINEIWWTRYQEKFAERVAVDQSWMEGGELTRQLANAFKRDPRYADIADEGEISHFPGKHLVWIILGIYNQEFRIGKLEDLVYEFMMASAARLTQSELGVIRNRIQAMANP